MAFNRTFLFGSTVLAGFAALTVTAAPAMAQANASPANQPPLTNQQNAEPTGPSTAQANPGDQAAQADESLGAQDDVVDAGQVTEGGDEVDAVIVTGSRIRRSPVNAPAPLIQLGREEVLQSGEPNIIDFLADIPALQTSVVPEDTTGSNLNDGGLSLLNLRNLGADRTLTLVDGRRHVGSVPNGLSVDVDTIPTLLIQNVEVVTGGQSALYGADAVSGVVNFILRRNFDGIEVDAALAEINDDGQLSGRVSALVGRNFLDDRLNVYAFGEYQEFEEVLDLDQDWRRDSWALLNNDSDPNNSRPDGILDNILIRGARDAFFTRGGILVLSNQVQPSSPATGVPFIPGTTLISDPDDAIANCGAVPAAGVIARTGLSANCTNIRFGPNQTAFTFNRDGAGRAFNFGTFQDQNGVSRRTNIGGDGLNSGTEFGQGSRLPESQAYRFQTGVNFQITPDIQLFGEAKYVREETFDSGQPTFFQLGITPVQQNQLPAGPGVFNSAAVFNIGLDNAFLDNNIRSLIQNNVRPVFDVRQTIVVNGATVANPAFGQQTGTLADPRAFLGVFGPSRSQFNTRELERYVVGARGDRDSLFGFVNNFSWEIGYTYGRVENANDERALDVERFQFAADAVRNSAGQIVCRVQDLASRGVTIADDVRGGTLAGNNPTVTGCTPLSLFGTDFRSDANEDNITGGGGRPGLTQAQAAYILAEITAEDINEQQDLLAFASGELWDFWGAGPIGLAVGFEYRDESTQSVGRDADTGDRFLFLNTGADFDEVSFDVNEFFGELRVPLLRDLPFVQNLEISGAYRRSDYSLESIGETDTYSLQGLYRPTQDIMFRATYGESVRIPTLGALFDPGGQTFANGLVDPCDSLALRNLTDNTIRNNRIQNCTALLGAGYDPQTTIINYPSGVPGSTGGNPGLLPEESRSYTVSLVLTPRFIPNLSIVFDHYDIKIEDAIAAVTTQQSLNQCVSGTTLDPQACAILTRNGFTAGDPASFRLVDFLQSSLNYASLEAKGIDFTVRYNFDLDYFDFVPRNAGRIDYALRGNYLIRQENFLNIADPGDATENDSLIGQPRVRFLQTVTYSPNERMSFTWDWDWQSAQEIVDEDVLVTDPDNRNRQFFQTEPFNQHDFSVRYQVRDDLTLRAGVVNVFDEEPDRYLGSTTTADNFDLFGRRFYLGLNFRR